MLHKLGSSMLTVCLPERPLPFHSPMQAKKQLYRFIDDFIAVRIHLAQRQISNFVAEKIVDGDKILVYGGCVLGFGREKSSLCSC